MAKEGLFEGIEVEKLAKKKFKTEVCRNCMEAKGASEFKFHFSLRGGPTGELVDVDIKGPLSIWKPECATSSGSLPIGMA